MTSRASVASTVIRPVEESDLAAIVSLLRREFSSRLTATELARLFNYRWSEPAPNRGFIVAAGEEVAGCIGTIYSRRLIAGVTTPVCNLTCWYVKPAFRSLGLPLLLAATAYKDHVITSLSPNPRSEPIYARMGFKTLSSGFTLVSLGVALRRAAAGVHLVTDAQQIDNALDEGNRRILRDHAAYPCFHYLIATGSEHSYVITKRRLRSRHPRLPVSEVLFASDPAFMSRHLAPLMRAVLSRERSGALAIDEMVLGRDKVEGKWRPRERLFKSPPALMAPKDGLYSEMVLLD